MAFGVKTNERPGTRCQVRYVRMSASKARVVLDLIRGKTVREAAEVLAFTERGAAEVIAKALNSAVANAMVNDGQDPNELYVSACYADEGPTLKRWRPRARGRATRIRKRTCHITVIVSRLEDERLAVLRNAEAARAARGGGRARTARDAAEARRRRVAGSRQASDDAPAAEEAAPAEDAGAEVTPGPWDGSALPLEDGSGPEGFEIKGNEESKLYHVPGSRHFNQTKAEYYFATVEAAEAAGFSAPGGGAEADDDATEEEAE
ncbi:MAG: 50S ribosomal protein L22 [Acidimicrobiia bacterium]